MDQGTAILENSALTSVGPVMERPVPTAEESALPAGIELISADNHWEVSEDIYFERFPDHLKDQAPRVWFEDFWRLGFPGLKEAGGIGPNIARTLTRGGRLQGHIRDSRIAELKSERIQQEVVFPQSLLGFPIADPEVREAMFRIYSEYIAEKSREIPNFHGVGVCYNWWDPERSPGVVGHLRELGLKTFMLPVHLKGVDGNPLSFADPVMDPLWAATSEAGLPVCLHIGEAANFEGRGGLAANMLAAFAPFRKPIGELIFGGVFDRHPDLKVVFAEGGLAWVLAWLQDAEAMFDTYGNGDLLTHIDHRPSHYWRKNCYATFQTDDLGLSHLDILGTDRVMWAQDYPHSEGTFGVTGKVVRAIIEKVGLDDAKLILGGNAKRVFNL